MYFGLFFVFINGFAAGNYRFLPVNTDFLSKKFSFSANLLFAAAIFPITVIQADTAYVLRIYQPK